MRQLGQCECCSVAWVQKQKYIICLFPHRVVLNSCCIQCLHIIVLHVSATLRNAVQRISFQDHRCTLTRMTISGGNKRRSPYRFRCKYKNVF